MAKSTYADKIAKLEAELKETKAAANRAKRKERNTHLMAFGIYMERLYKEQGPEGRGRMRAQLESATLEARVKRLALDGFNRLDEQAPTRPNPAQDNGTKSAG